MSNVVINHIQLTVTDQNMPYLPPYHEPILNSAKFCENRNSAETGKFRGLAQNSTFCGKLWSLLTVLFACLYIFYPQCTTVSQTDWRADRQTYRQYYQANTVCSMIS